MVSGVQPFAKAVMKKPYFDLTASGAVSMFGSSVLVYSNNNKAIAQKVMGDAFGERHLGIMVTKGMGYYGCRFWSKMNRKRTFRALKSFNLMGDPSFLKNGSLSTMREYAFLERIVSDIPMNLELEAADRISSTGGMDLNSAILSFNAGNFVVLGGSISTNREGMLKAHAGKKVEVGGTTHIRQGSSVEITAGTEIVLLPGCKIDVGTNVTLQVTGK